jgi:hypothetical protein
LVLPVPAPAITSSGGAVDPFTPGPAIPYSAAARCCAFNVRIRPQNKPLCCGSAPDSAPDGTRARLAVSVSLAIGSDAAGECGRWRGKEQLLAKYAVPQRMAARHAPPVRSLCKRQ